MMKLAFLILGFMVSAVSMVRREARDGVRVGTDKVLNKTEAEERLEARRKLSVEPPAIVAVLLLSNSIVKFTKSFWKEQEIYVIQESLGCFSRCHDL